MGGNIKFFTQTRRYNAREYHDVMIDVMYFLKESIFECPETITYKHNIEAIQPFLEKESFGDLDIVVNSKYLLPNYVDIIVSEFNLRVGDWSKNGNVLSFVYQELQVDLIVTPEEDFQTSLDYFAYNDCGNLVGRIAKKFGIKFGHKGSHVIVRDGDQQIAEILLTKETSELFELLDLNFDKWTFGFKNMEELFVWVSNSKYFNKDIYLLHNRNHYSRTRDAKRKTYHEFLEWCKDKQFTNNYQYEDITEKDGYNIRYPFIDYVIEKFPHIQFQIADAIDKHNLNKQFKEVFNGNIISKILNIGGKELGGFMQYCRENYFDEPHIKETYIELAEDEYERVSMIQSLWGSYITENKYNPIPLSKLYKQRVLDK